LVAEHWPHAPDGWQAGDDVGHWLSLAQAWQACVVVLQMGVVPPQFAFDVQGTQVALAVSQAGVAPLHLVAFVAEHCPQAPLPWHAGVALGHSESPAQARQVWLVVLQTGVEPPHWALEVQGTHVPVPVKHTGVAPEHWAVFVAEHCAHAPLAWQAGVDPPHSPSLAQARQVCVAVLQTGVVPPQFASDVQGTHVPADVRQAGVAPAHRVVFVAEHWPQAPLPWQAGVALGHSLSEPQARHAWVVVLQTGVVPPQVALLVHGTHVPVVVKQAGVAPEHCVVFVAEHWPHEPFGWQAGAEPGHCASLVHAWQTWVVVLQTGVEPPHWAFEVHGTQTPVVA
jgi:hypothetical protein